MQRETVVRLDAQLVNDLRVQRGLSDSELAETIGYQPSTLDIVLRRGTCNLITAERIAVALGVYLHDVAVQLDDDGGRDD